jgi:hypothetical protein
MTAFNDAANFAAAGPPDRQGVVEGLRQSGSLCRRDIDGFGGTTARDCLRCFADRALRRYRSTRLGLIPFRCRSTSIGVAWCAGSPSPTSRALCPAASPLRHELQPPIPQPRMEHRDLRASQQGWRKDDAAEHGASFGPAGLTAPHAWEKEPPAGEKNPLRVCRATYGPYDPHTLAMRTKSATRCSSWTGRGSSGRGGLCGFHLGRAEGVIIHTDPNSGQTVRATSNAVRGYNRMASNFGNNSARAQ